MYGESGNDAEAHIIEAEDRRTIAWTANSYDYDKDEEVLTPEDTANGVLIAAVPDLLAACEAVAECAGDAPNGEAWSTAWCEWVDKAIEKARTAVAKAKAV